MRNTLVNKITKAAKSNKDIFILSGDAGFGVFDDYKKNYPQRFLNLGVAEQNTISFASGLALTGFKVVVYNIVPFLLYRPYEQIRNDICYQELPVVLVGIGSGITYAPQGVTHYSVEDIAIARTLPNLVILSPSDPIEAELCAEFALKSKQPVYIRIAKSGEPVIHQREITSIVHPIVLQEGDSKAAVLFHGSIGPEVIKAIEGLTPSPRVISVPMLQPLDFNSLTNNLKGIDTVFTVEEHFVNGGLGSIICEWLEQSKSKIKLIKLGIKNEFIHAIKNNASMRQSYGISAEEIRKAVNQELIY